jgi:hypothetical protein
MSTINNKSSFGDKSDKSKISIHIIPDSIDAEIVEWLCWRYNHEYTDAHKLFLRHLCAIKSGFRTNEKYFLVCNPVYKQCIDFDTCITSIYNNWPTDIDIVYCTHYMQKITNDNFYFSSTSNKFIECYIMTRDYAEKLLRLYDKSFRNIISLTININLFYESARSLTVTYPLMYRDDTIEYKYYYAKFYKN